MYVMYSRTLCALYTLCTFGELPEEVSILKFKIDVHFLKQNWFASSTTFSLSTCSL